MTTPNTCKACSPDISISGYLRLAVISQHEVHVHMEHKFYTTAISRLYYGCYHATTALLLTKDLIAKTHGGVASLLHQHFVKNGAFDMEQASFFSPLMKERIDGDYNDFLVTYEDEVEEFIAPAKDTLHRKRNPIEKL